MAPVPEPPSPYVGVTGYIAQIKTPDSSTYLLKDSELRGFFSDHEDNTTIHTDSSEKATWNAKADISDIPTTTSQLTNNGSDGTAQYLETDEVAYRTSSIPYGACDSTSTATVFTASVPGITELRDGVCMWLKNGVITSAANFTLNINGLGAKPVYSNMAAATAETTIFNVNYTMLFVYDSTRVSGGCWVCYRGYDSNTNTIGYQLRTNSVSLPMKSAVYRYRILFTSADGEYFVPANNSTSTNATSSRTVCQDKIDPFGRIVYYGSTTAVAANSRPGVDALWDQYAITFGYSFNNTGAALTLTSWKPVYLKCAPQSDGSAIIDSTTPYVQDLPTTEDGKIYIFLGIAYSATTIELMIHHPVYWYKDGIIRLYTNGHEHSNKSVLDGITATNVSNWNTAATNSHTHSNKSLLDTYTQTEANLADAVSKKHSHSNKSVLDGITAAQMSKLDTLPTIVTGGNDEIYSIYQDSNSLSLVPAKRTFIFSGDIVYDTEDPQFHVRNVDKTYAQFLNALQGDKLDSVSFAADVFVDPGLVLIGEMEFVLSGMPSDGLYFSTLYDGSPLGLSRVCYVELFCDSSTDEWSLSVNPVQQQLSEGTDYLNKTHLDAAYVALSSVGANSGVAELDSNGKVPTSQLPSYVDDVVEYASLSNFPATGESGKIYIAIDTNLTYRWGGTEYVNISSSLALGETSSTAYRGDRGKIAYDHSQNGDVHVTTTQKTNWNTAYTNSHTHANKSLLDSYDQTNANISDAVSKKHTHSNKTVLDGIASTDITAWNGKYTKPSTGIPSTDLATAVQTSLGLADTAVQDASYVHTDNNYTTTDKNKLAGIAAGAEVNVQSDWNQTTTTADDYIKNKPTSMTPTAHSHGDITNAGDITTTATIANGDRLVINDESASKITNSSITFGTSTTTFLANNGTWQSASTTDTKNTAGATDTSSKIYLVGAIEQTANPQTYTDDQVYATSGQLDANKVRVAEAVTLQYNATDKCLEFIFA